MSGENEQAPKEPPALELQPGYCCPYAVTKQGIQDEIKKPDLPRTSDYFHTCNLPAKFEHPHWFNGYGCQVSKQHPLYRTTTSDYGWYTPGYHSVPTVYFPRGQRFTNHLAASGMYRNYSLNTAMDVMQKEGGCK